MSIILLFVALCIFALHATETADFPSLFICHNVSDRQEAFFCHKKANILLYCIGLEESSPIEQKQMCHHLTRGHRCEAKGVIVYTCASDWFRRENSQPNMAIMTVYRTVFCVLPLENFIAGLSKMAAKSTNTNFSACIGVNQQKLCFFFR